jgi:chromosome segregation ATPase
MSVREPEAVREHIDSLQHQVNELKESVEQARRETSQQVTARVEQVKAALSRQAESASDDAGQAAGQTQNQWQAMKADLAAKMRDLHDRIERKKGEVKADVADDDAMVAEGAAVDALDYASWTVWQAELTVLDAIDARARADERAASSR